MNAAAFAEAIGAGAPAERGRSDAARASRLLAAASDLAAALAPGDGPRQERIAFFIARMGGGLSIDQIAAMKGLKRGDIAQAIKDVYAAREAGRAFDTAIDHAQKAMVHVRRAIVILEENP